MHTQDLLDSAARPFVGITDALPARSLLGAAAVVAVVGGIAAWRFAIYSRREYIVAAMLRKYFPKGEAGIEGIKLRRNRPHNVWVWAASGIGVRPTCRNCILRNILLRFAGS